MINAKELLVELTHIRLLQEEAKLLTQIEERTDEIIRTFFKKHTYAFVPLAAFSCLNDLHKYRKNVILSIWKKRYEENSWKIVYDDGMDPGWHFTIKE
jgi:hypothetical protein